MRFILLAAAVAVLIVQGCSPDGTAPRTGEPARLRLVSASPDAGGLDLLVNGRTVAQGVGPTAASTTAEVEAGDASGEVRASGSAAVLGRLALPLAAGKSYSVLASGPVQALTLTLSVDTGFGGGPPPVEGPPPPPVDSGAAPPPVTDAARVRIVHAAPDAPPLDPYLTEAGAPLDTLPTLQPFEYGSLALTADLVRRPGRYSVRFTAAGTTHVVLASAAIDAAAGELLTVVLGENADKSLRVDVVEE
jgi:hypothetical protein